VAGDDLVEVTVTLQKGLFEVHPDRMERPPKTDMRLRDLVRILALRADINKTLYTRQAPLWPMPALLSSLSPLDWMEAFRIFDLNVWIGDGHFHNTLHNDPYDNFLCGIRGRKHLLLFPPEQTPNLYYAQRRDIQAFFAVSRGEYGRKDTGIISSNTAGVDMASLDLETFPLFARALESQTYCELGPGDILYLPRGHHHHVFSEPDPDEGSNLALNVWIHREQSLAEPPAVEDPINYRAPTLEQIHRSLSGSEAAASAESCAAP